MKKKTRNILLVLGAFVILAAGVAGLAVYKIYSMFSNLGVVAESNIPEEIRAPAVLRGADFLEKKEIFKVEPKGYWKTVFKSWQIRDEKERQKQISAEIARSILGFSDVGAAGNERIAVGAFGAYVFDPDGNFRREILFEPSFEKIKIGSYETGTYATDADNSQIVRLTPEKFGFLAQSNALKGVTVYDDAGAIVWQYGANEINLGALAGDEKSRNEEFKKMIRTAGAAVGDLDGDGRSEFVVASYNDGYRAFDQSGRELWFQPEKEPKRDLQILDLDGDGKNEIVLLTGMKAEILDANGKPVDRFAKRFASETRYIDGRFPTEAAGGGRGFGFFIFDDNRLAVFDEAGTPRLETEAPLSEITLKTPLTDRSEPYEGGSYTRESEEVYAPRAASVALKAGERKFLAFVAPFSLLPRSIFYVYDADGRLVYHEILSEKAETIAAIPAANGNEEIIIGGKRTVWKYAARR